MTHDPRNWTIGLIGYGEVGRILAEDLRARDLRVRAFDRKLAGALAGPLRRHADAHGVVLGNAPVDTVAGCSLVVSAVTAAQAVPAATAMAPHLAPGTYVLDLNSAAPASKCEAAVQVNANGGRYVEAAVMAPVPPQRIGVPMLLGGADADSLLPVLRALGFNARIGSREPGMVSATKLCRSVVVKGLEALLVEALTAARAHGVDSEVLASLRDTFPGLDWEALAGHCFERVATHGRRRSEEMAEAARTVRAAGFPARMAAATGAVQAAVADIADDGGFAGGAVGWRDVAGRIPAATPTPWNPMVLSLQGEE
ncbi:DUF1932 domain-containing protein [Luteimonas sp. BDR2-5]|uniref:NAD(P)-dependent oxidoreductase n=1 Tax=Proluteimonas luteida TaxID=2878685 RepID=UPI001E36194E|nr:DUF1932 domain-containing protein [Luteimonas sp. BDR2-5]MCD9028739.1 DUF1932 domain-containing protein [Luteimonas sp. BDR2-5]